MTDFDISHYYTEDEFSQEEKTEKLREMFYGDMSEKPDTEIRCFELQEEYLRTRDHRVWIKLFQEMFPYVRSLILKKKKAEERAKWEESDDISSKASTATYLFMCQYLRKPTFEVGASFAGMVNGKILEVLYGGAHDFDISLNTTINDDGDEIIDIFQLEDTDDDIYNPEDQVIEKIKPIDIINQVFEEADEISNYDLRMSLLLRCYVLVYFRKPKNRHAKKTFFKLCKNQKEEDFLERTLLEVYNRLKG